MPKRTAVVTVEVYQDDQRTTPVALGARRFASGGEATPTGGAVRPPAP